MVCACVRARVCVHVCVCAEVIEVYDTMSCLPIVSDRVVIEESKYFELGRQPLYCFQIDVFIWLHVTDIYIYI